MPRRPQKEGASRAPKRAPGTQPLEPEQTFEGLARRPLVLEDRATPETGATRTALASAPRKLSASRVAPERQWFCSRSRATRLRELLERATGVEPATSSLGRAPTRESRGNPRMKILKRQGFSDFRLPACDPDFRSFPGNFVRNLPENLPFRSTPDSTKTNFLMTSSFGRASGDFFL